MSWAPIETAPKIVGGEEISVRDAAGRECLAWWDGKADMWRCGGVQQGFPLVPSLDAHPWTEWKAPDVLRIGLPLEKGSQ